MRYGIGYLVAVLLVSALAFAPTVRADEGVPTAEEVRRAEGMPPIIPHAVSDRNTDKDCLVCHLKGKKGTPATSHPERKACNQCHVPAQFGAKEAKKKRK